MSPEIFSEFWPILIMPQSSLTLIVLGFLSLPVPLSLFGNCSIIIFIFTPWEFFTSTLADYLSLESEWQKCLLKSPGLFEVLWRISTRPISSNSSCLFDNPLVTVQKVPITIGVIVTFIFHSFFNSLAMSRYITFFTLSFNFTLWLSKFIILQVLYFVDYYNVWSSGWDLVICCISKSHWSVCFSFSRRDAGLCIYHLFVWSNLNFYYRPKWITLPA